MDAHRLAVLTGSGIGGLSTIENEQTKLLDRGPRRVSPLMIPMIIGNILAGNIAIRFGAKGLCHSLVTACATGTHCLGAVSYTHLDVYKRQKKSSAAVSMWRWCGAFKTGCFEHFDGNGRAVEEQCEKSDKKGTMARFGGPI